MDSKRCRDVELNLQFICHPLHWEAFEGQTEHFFNATLEAEQKNNNTPRRISTLSVVINLNLINNA